LKRTFILGHLDTLDHTFIISGGKTSHRKGPTEEREGNILASRGRQTLLCSRTPKGGKIQAHRHREEKLVLEEIFNEVVKDFMRRRGCNLSEGGKESKENLQSS